MVDEGGKEFLDDLLARFQQQAFSALGQLAPSHARHGVGDTGALVLGAQVDLRGTDGQAGRAALAFEDECATVGSVDVREQDLALVVGIYARDVGPQGDGVFGRGPLRYVYASRYASLQHRRIREGIPGLVLGGGNPLGICNAHGCLLAWRCCEFILDLIRGNANHTSGGVSWSPGIPMAWR
ncbi:hypothetical protein D3C85_339610 [compost metagenome]